MNASQSSARGWPYSRCPERSPVEIRGSAGCVFERAWAVSVSTWCREPGMPSPSRKLSDKLRTALLLASELGLPLLDSLVPKRKSLWAFPYTREAYWSSNQRALFDYVRAKRPDIEALPIDLSAQGRLWILRHREIWHLLRSKVVVIHHGPSDYRRVLARWPLSRRMIYNLWHGVNIKTIGLQDTISAVEARNLRSRAKFYHGVTASSEANRRSLIDGLGVEPPRVHVTGLPRNDWLICADSDLPDHLQEQLRRLRDRLAGRRLVLYAPTFRSAHAASGDAGSTRRSYSAGFYDFSPSEHERLQRLLSERGAVLGCRAHVNASAEEQPEGSLDLSAAEFPETQVLLREAALLVTDYSGIWVDYLLTGRPMLAFCHDRDSFGGDRGLIYDLSQVFPGARVDTFEEFATEVDQALATNAVHPLYAHATSMFHAHVDERSSERVVGTIEKLI